MSDEVITVKEVLQQMKNSPRPFSISYWTCDLKQQTGGELKRVEKAWLKKAVPATFRPMPQARPAVKHRRNPQHDDNHTVNIKLLPGGEIRTVHVPLIELFNGKKVIW